MTTTIDPNGTRKKKEKKKNKYFFGAKENVSFVEFEST